MEKDLVIFGSCVSRDAITGSDLEARLKYYHCRSNLCSMANNVPLNRDLALLKKFETRNVLEDLNKTIRFDHDGCFIVFDFIDDRFPVGRIGASDFTYNFLVDKQSPDTFAGAERIRHFDPKNRDMVKLAAKNFFEAHEDMFSNNIIILHETSFNIHYDGLALDPSRLQLLNDHLDFLHDHLRVAWKIDHSVSSRAMLTSPQATPVDHRWGHAPFHYFEEYNSGINKQLSYIMGETGAPTLRRCT